MTAFSLKFLKIQPSESLNDLPAAFKMKSNLILNLLDNDAKNQIGRMKRGVIKKRVGFFDKEFRNLSLMKGKLNRGNIYRKSIDRKRLTYLSERENSFSKRDVSLRRTRKLPVGIVASSISACARLSWGWYQLEAKSEG